MIKVGVVILNYLNYEDTIECIESIKYDDYDNKEIIVVDNGSSNESWRQLVKKYKNNDEIHLLRSDKNLGFAKGNNIGIKFARKELKCEFVLLINNDTISKNKDLITKIVNSYSEGVGVIGCRILSADDREQNPVLCEFNKQVVKDKIKYRESTIFKFRKIINKMDLYIKIKNMKSFKKLKSSVFENSLKKSKENLSVQNIDRAKTSQNLCSQELILHGACMMLTKDYFKYYPYLYPKTFLYFEENILTLLTQKVGLDKMFINNTYIFHKEDQSSEMSFQNSSEIKQKYHLESMKYCYELFDMSYEEILRKCFDE